MERLNEYFQTYWSAMTLHDWLGLGITIVVFFVMVALYVYVFRPSNKAKWESHRYIPLDDDDLLYGENREHSVHIEHRENGK